MPEDVHSLFHDVLRHRVVLSYEALAADVRPDQVLDAIIDAIRSPTSSSAVAAPTADRTPEALLRRVELRVARRLDGLLQGERQGRRPGPGGEPALTRAYEDGDDVRWVNWPLSARVGEPMVRVPEIEPVLTAWALVDLSASMTYGTAGQTKLDLARDVLAGLGVVLRRRGDRLGVIASRNGDIDHVRPPRADRRGLVAALAALGMASVEGEAAAAPTWSARSARSGGSPATAAPWW